LKPIIDGDKGTKKEFDSERKSAVYLREAISSAVRCQICGSRVHTKSISIDHAQRKQDGGTANIDNGQISHPYCNTTYKEWLHHEANKGVVS
jgi:HNH endonuclease